tara:strand:- start:603 stop:926 length:324 start_codon:yes stop_codon:yes gene_type:complete
MNKFITIILLGFLAILISGCNVVKEGFASSKKNSGDEFMIEKKSPLIMPPDYKELPIPSTGTNLKDNDKNVVRDLIKKPKKNKIDSNELDKNDQNLENSVLKKIKKN